MEDPKSIYTEVLNKNGKPINLLSESYIKQCYGKDQAAGNIVLSRNNIPCTIVDEDTVLPGRAHRANVLQPAPGLTAYSHQRIRENPISDTSISFSATVCATIMF